MLGNSERERVHTRRIVRGLRRRDGLWEIEATVIDEKGEDMPFRSRPMVRPGQSLHDITIAVLIDDDAVIHGVAARMQTGPGRPVRKARPPIAAWSDCRSARASCARCASAWAGGGLHSPHRPARAGRQHLHPGDLADADRPPVRRRAGSGENGPTAARSASSAAARRGGKTGHTPGRNIRSWRRSSSRSGTKPEARTRQRPPAGRRSHLQIDDLPGLDAQRRPDTGRGGVQVRGCCGRGDPPVPAAQAPGRPASAASATRPTAADKVCATRSMPRTEATACFADFRAVRACPAWV